MAPARRDVLRASLGAAATALVVGGATLPAAAAAGRGAARAAGGPGDPLPPVPGMRGDRRANELWYQLDQATLYHPSQEFTDAYLGLAALFGGAWDRTVLNTWRELVVSPAYRERFTEFTAPGRPHFEVISRIQLGVFDSVYRPADPRLVPAFAAFAQGTLYDPRTGALHVMTGSPPGGYPIWHVVMRAMMFLGIDAHRWAALAPLNAFGCAVQLRAKPDLEHVNQPLPEGTVRLLAARWLPLGLRQLDAGFQSFPYPEEPPQG